MPAPAPSIAALSRRLNILSSDYEAFLEGRLTRCGLSGGRQKRLSLHWLRTKLQRQFLPHYFGEPPAWRVALRSSFADRTLPDFCVTGPIKAGTSDIATTLLLHPCVMTPLAKEISFTDFPRLSAYYPTIREKKAIETKYGTALSPYFMPALNLLEFAYKLSNIASQMKIVIVLRNPIWRMYSHWKWELLLTGTHVLKDMTFMHTFDAYADKSLALYPHTPMYTACAREGLRTSIYWQAVEVWQSLFGTANILVVESDEYFRNKTAFMYKIQDFVGLPRLSPPSIERRVNENPLTLCPPSDETLERLTHFFRPHNDSLWKAIGTQFAW